MDSSVQYLIELAFQEDIGSGDITTDSVIAPDAEGTGRIVAKESMIIAGLDLAREVFEFLDPDITICSNYKDGDKVKKGKVVMEFEGRMRTLLIGERTALNFLQRLSGIATNVRSYVDALEGKNVRLVDTRKTTPGWRTLEKYAVRMGGAHNHRMGLYDGVLIKDNHIAACGGITKAIETVRKKISHLVKIEVEVSDMSGVKEALKAGAEVIMLDNMSIPQIEKAVKIIKKKAIVEVSGGITKKKLPALADTGVDIISVGALTHAARSYDLSMRIDEKEDTFVAAE
ncbi:MAG: carboxylating nicotinate-nucleotide diphosphorylase [Desulfobacterales bacterium]|nr:carboxylating nicotinate-nucleotide diphosphorylase [Desulfobacterales bacterium]